MQVFTFPLNERGDAKLIVSVHNVPPMMGMPQPPTPALIHVPGGGAANRTRRSSAAG